MSKKLTFKGISIPKKATTVNQDQRPNFRDKDGRLFLVRCFACGPVGGSRENWAMAVSRGTCAFCGWMEKNKKFKGEK